MKRHLILMAFLVCTVLPSAAGAQTSTPSAGKPADAAANATPTVPDYQLGAEDAFSVVILNHPEISSPTVVVPPDGKITLPLLGDPIGVKDMTVQDLTKLLTERYRKFIVNPFVTVTLTKRRQEFVTLAGFAGAASMDYHSNMRISEVLAPRLAAGQVADFSKVTVTRKDSSKLTLDMTNLAQKAGTDADIFLRAGDIVFVPQRIVQFSVLGEVEKPGSYDFVRDDITILDAITAAGNPKETADLSAATITENGKEEKLDLYTMLRVGDLSHNRKITPGTSIMIPEIHDRTYIFGSVSKPGYYNFKPGDRMLDALNFSAPLQMADLGRVNHIRVDKKANTAKVTVVNVTKFLKMGKLDENIALAAGDVLYIPERRKSFGLGDLLSWMSPLGIIDNTARIFTRGLGSNRY
jgi:protein involved in polysaccharide export with SLBB domain